MNSDRSRQRLGLYLLGTLLVCLTATEATAQSRLGRAEPEAIPRPPPEVQRLVRTLHRDRIARTRVVGPVGEMAATLDRVRFLVWDTVRASAAGDGSGPAQLLEAAVQRLEGLFPEVAQAHPDGGGARTKLTRIRSRLDELSARVGGIVAARDEATRQRLARDLLRDLEAQLPAERRLAHDRALQPTVRAVGPEHPRVNAATAPARGKKP